MPTLRTYLGLAPFSIEEIVDAANSVLRERPRLHVAKRTVRYYVSERVVPPPVGPPKLARYEAVHLIRLVAARCLADAGLSLEAVRRDLDGLPTAQEAAALVVQDLIDGSSIIEEKPLVQPADPTLVRRTPVGRIVIESPADLSANELLHHLQRAIQDLKNTKEQ